MKHLLIAAVAGFCLLSVVGCKSTNSSDAGSMNVYPATVGPVDNYRPIYEVNEKTPVSGSAKVSILFGIFSWGDSSKFADNASLFGGSWWTLFSAKETAAKAAFYSACKQANCDAVVAARYEIETEDYFVFKTMKVNVKGFPATMKRVEVVKPMLYYVNGKGDIVILKDIVTPIDIGVSKSSGWFF